MFGHACVQKLLTTNKFVYVNLRDVASPYPVYTKTVELLRNFAFSLLP